MTTVLNTELRVAGRSESLVPQPLRYAARTSARGSLALDLLFYDQVILYLSDFGPVIDLALWLGDSTFTRLLEERALRIAWGPAQTAHLPHDAAHVPNGGKPGLNAFELYASQNREVFDTEQHLERSLRRLTNWGKERRATYRDTVLAHTDQVVDQEMVREAIEETRTDALDSAIRQKFGLESTDDRSLRTEDPDVRRFLRLNELNVGLKVAEAYPEADLHAERGLGTLASHKANRSARSVALEKNLAFFADAQRLPDPNTLGADLIAFQKITALRGSDSGRSFRAWTAKSLDNPGDGRDLLQSYIADLRINRSPVSAVISVGISVASAILLATGLPGVEASVSSLEPVTETDRRWRISGFLDKQLSSILAASGDNRADPLTLRLPSERR